MKRVRTGLIIEVNYMSRLIDLSGKRFGRLVAIRPEGHSINGNIRWLCHCDCGNNAIMDGFELRRGTTKSCGCLRREVMKKQYQENPVMQKFKGRSSNLYDSKGVAYASIKRSKRNHSGVIGVSYDEKTDHWFARLMFHGRYVLMKSCDTFEEAVEARQAVERQYLGKTKSTK